MSTVLHPTVLWAQRKDKLFVTIDVQDCKDPKITVTNDAAAKAGKINFKGHAHSHATGPDEHSYVLDFELYGEVDPDDVKTFTTDRTISLIIAKKESDGPHWPRLLKTPGKAPQYLKVDWNRYVDEDEEDELDMAGQSGGFDMSQLQNLEQFGGGMGGMGGGGGMPGMPPGMAGMDLGAMMGGMGGMGGMDFGNMNFEGMGEGDEEDESDDEDLPPLEPAAGPSNA